MYCFRSPSARQRLVWLTSCCLVLIFLLLAVSPVCAADPFADPSPLFAGWFSQFLSTLGTRSRVVQVCIVTMCLALFILMKK